MAMEQYLEMAVVARPCGRLGIVLETESAPSDWVRRIGPSRSFNVRWQGELGDPKPGEPTMQCLYFFAYDGEAPLEKESEPLGQTPFLTTDARAIWCALSLQGMADCWLVQRDESGLGGTPEVEHVVACVGDAPLVREVLQDLHAQDEARKAQGMDVA